MLELGIICALGGAGAFGYARGWRPKRPGAESVSTIVELAGFGAITAAAFLFNLEIGLLVAGILLVAAATFVIVDPDKVLSGEEIRARRDKALQRRGLS